MSTTPVLAAALDLDFKNLANDQGVVTRQEKKAGGRPKPLRATTIMNHSTTHQSTNSASRIDHLVDGGATATGFSTSALTNNNHAGNAGRNRNATQMMGGYTSPAMLMP